MGAWTKDNKIKSLKEFGCNLNNYNPYEHSDQPPYRSAGKVPCAEISPRQSAHARKGV